MNYRKLRVGAFCLLLSATIWPRACLANLCNLVLDAQARGVFTFTKSLRIDEKMDPLEEIGFVGNWARAISRIADESFQQARIENPGLDRATYYQSFLIPRQTRQHILDSGHHANGQDSDTRMVVDIPKEYEIWSKLSPIGRKMLSEFIATTFSRAKYEARDPEWIMNEARVEEQMVELANGGNTFTSTGFEGKPPEDGFSPLRLLGAAQKKMACGECRLAAYTVAALLAELGAKKEDVRVASSGTHVWVEIRYSEKGQWMVLDATPGRPNALVRGQKISEAHPEYTEYAEVYPYTLQPDSGREGNWPVLNRTKGHITGLEFIVGHRTKEALELRAAHQDTLTQLTLGGTLEDIRNHAGDPGVQELIRGKYSKIRIIPKTTVTSYDPKHEEKIALQIMTTLEEAGTARGMPHLTLAGTNPNAAIIEKLSSQWPALTSLEAHFNAESASALLRSPVGARLEFIDFTSLSREEVAPVIKALSEMPTSRLKQINFGQVRGITAETRERIRKLQAERPECEWTITYLEKLF